MLVKIIRSSIRKNPKAGETRTIVGGCTHATFEIKGDMPEWLVDGDNCAILERAHDGAVKGVLFNPNNWERLVEDPKFNISVQVNRDVEIMHHRPSPKFLFEYEDPAVICDNCHSAVPVSKIEVDYSDEDIRYEQCPVCGDIDSFEAVEYEDLQEALKGI